MGTLNLISNVRKQYVAHLPLCHIILTQQSRALRHPTHYTHIYNLLSYSIYYYYFRYSTIDFGFVSPIECTSSSGDGGGSSNISRRTQFAASTERELIFIFYFLFLLLKTFQKMFCSVGVGRF